MAPAAETVQRSRAIDVAKGLAIIAIVVGHVWRGLGSAGLMTIPRATYTDVDTAIYAVHLPLFAFLAGLFVRRSVANYGRRTYLARRATDFLWLYVLWTSLQGLVRLWAAEGTNHPLTPATFLETFWVKDSQLWFLPFLLVAMVSAALVRPWRSRVIAAVTTLLLTVLALALWGVDLPWVGLAGIPLLPFFWVGTLLGADRLEELWKRWPWWALSLLGAGVTGVALTLTDLVTATWTAYPRTPVAVLAGATAAVAGTVAVVAFSQGIADAGLGVTALLAWIGSRSLEIFLAHILATAGCRVALVHLEVTSWPTHLALGTLCGLAFPLALRSAVHRTPARSLFAAPSIIRPRLGSPS